MFARCSIVRAFILARSALCLSLSLAIHLIHLIHLAYFSNENTQDYPGSLLLFTTATAIELNQPEYFSNDTNGNVSSLNWCLCVCGARGDITILTFLLFLHVPALAFAGSITCSLARAHTSAFYHITRSFALSFFFAPAFFHFFRAVSVSFCLQCNTNDEKETQYKAHQSSSTTT